MNKNLQQKKNGYRSLYKEHNELEADNIENEGIFKYGNDFEKSKIAHDRFST